MKASAGSVSAASGRAVWERADVTDRDSLHALLDHRAIEALHADYADVVNRRAWDELAPLFHDDATVTLDLVTRDPIVVEGADGLATFLGDAMARFAFLEFVPLTLKIDLPTHDAPDDASARLWMREDRRDVDTLAWSTAYGLYRDDYRRDGETWRFRRRRYRSITRTDGEVFPLPPDL